MSRRSGEEVLRGDNVGGKGHTYFKILRTSLIQINPPRRSILRGINSVRALVDEVEGEVCLVGEIAAAEWCDEDL